jgi:hypothetical protein
MTWQEWLDTRVRALGLTETSGYRTPAQERALGGPASSYHSRGTRKAPGAIDVGGPADKLRQLFDDIKQAFAGRINELYLNVPGGDSVSIKDNRYLRINPEEGRARHLHVALGTGEPPVRVEQPSSRIPAGERGEKALEAAPADVCVRNVCLPVWGADIRRGLGLEPEKPICWCWSDIWVYGSAVTVIIAGMWMVGGRKE